MIPPSLIGSFPTGQSFGQLKPVVMELPITDIKGKGSEGMEKGVSGILGMDFLARFDVRLDFQTGEGTDCTAVQ